MTATGSSRPGSGSWGHHSCLQTDAIATTVCCLVYHCALKVKVNVSQLCPTLLDSIDYSPWNSLGQNTGVGSLSLLHRIFPTQGSNPGLPHRGQILYQLSYQGSLGTLAWVAYPFSNGSSRPKNQTGISCIAGRFFTN